MKTERDPEVQHLRMLQQAARTQAWRAEQDLPFAQDKLDGLRASIRHFREIEKIFEDLIEKAKYEAVEDASGGEVK